MFTKTRQRETYIGAIIAAAAAPTGTMEEEAFVGQNGLFENSLQLLDSREQLSLPVRQAKDLGSERNSIADRDKGIALTEVTEPSIINQPLGSSRICPPMLLQVAANPFDFWPLIEQGLVEWSRTSDALIDGAPLPGAPDLLRAGLGSGVFDLFLGEAQEVGDEAVDRPIHGSFFVKGDGKGVEIDVGVPVQLLQQRRGQRAAHLFDIVSVFHGYLQGHLLWVTPEYRGRGLVGGYFDAALDVARRHGLKGFMFLSTLPFWEWRAPRYGFTARFRIIQDDGPDAIAWFREVY